jgi:hypothetical protein
MFQNNLLADHTRLTQTLALDKIEVLCTCSHRSKVVFACLAQATPTCAQNLTQPFYCLDCSQDPGKHEHKSITIANGMEVMWARWETLREGLAREVA